VKLTPNSQQFRAYHSASETFIHICINAMTIKYTSVWNYKYSISNSAHSNIAMNIWCMTKRKERREARTSNTAFTQEKTERNSGKWPTWFTIPFYDMFISFLYMFRATPCSSSGGQIVLIQHLVESLSKWPSGNLERVTIQDAVLIQWPPDDEHGFARNM